MHTDQSVRSRAPSHFGAKRASLRVGALLALLVLMPLPGSASESANERREGVDKVKDSAKVVREIMGASDKAIPSDLLQSAECVAVFPNVIKGAFIFGGSGGSGCVVARDPKTGRFGQPLFLKIGGGSVGFQIGASSTDFVLMGMNDDAQSSIAKGEWTARRRRGGRRRAGRSIREGGHRLEARLPVPLLLTQQGGVRGCRSRWFEDQSRSRSQSGVLRSGRDGRTDSDRRRPPRSAVRERSLGACDDARTLRSFEGMTRSADLGTGPGA